MLADYFNGLNGDWYSRFFTDRMRERGKGDSILDITAEEYGGLSHHVELSGLQSASSIRNVLTSRRLAKALIGEKGELDEAALSVAIQGMEQHLHSLGPGRQGDDIKNVHILRALKNLKGQDSLRKELRRVDKPASNKNADQLIRETLALPKTAAVTHVEARQAVLSAYFCFLRQSVGSCFATAPAMIVHVEQPDLFFQDMIDLLSFGYLKRTFGGEEYTAPLSTSWGAGDLRRQILVSKDLKEGKPIWNSPGLINALQKVGVLSDALSFDEKAAEVKKKILAAFKDADLPGERFYLTVEDLLQMILLLHHEISHADVEEYLNRPHEMIHSDLMMGLPKGKFGKSGIGDRCNQFLIDFEEASDAFKGLADNALLKAWEFTLATFSETKSNFSKWNLFTSLGLNSQDRGGIGERLHFVLKEKLDQENRKIVQLNDQYEQVYTQLKFMEGRLTRASEQESRWLRAEYQSRLNEYQTIEEIRSKAVYRAESFANLYDVLIDHYLRLFPKYFQEIYDADMHHVQGGMYDDSPAGFQLIYKYGRASAASWAPVKSLSEFVSALTSFFTTTEYEIRTDPVYKGFEDDISEIVSMIVMHIKTEEFLESAFYRMAANKGASIPQKPLENLDKIDKKPWAYTSGGNLSSLISCYFKRDEIPTEKERWIESPIELLVFMVDVLREAPESVRKLYVDDPEKMMLINSPTHAFNLKPGYPLFRKGWESDVYTYTFCRDALVMPREEFIRSILLNGEQISTLLHKLKAFLPFSLHIYFERATASHPMMLRVKEFRKYVLDSMSQNLELADAMRFYLRGDDIDAFLYRQLPFTAAYKLPEVVKKAIPRHLQDEVKKNLDALTPLPSQFTAEELRTLLKGTVAWVLGSTSAPNSFFSEIDLSLQHGGYAMPAPILFADTNWTVSRFGLVVNPGTGELDLWRLNETGTDGMPMSMWRKYLEGPDERDTWGIYSNPHEYLYETQKLANWQR